MDNKLDQTIPTCQIKDARDPAFLILVKQAIECMNDEQKVKFIKDLDKYEVPNNEIPNNEMANNETPNNKALENKSEILHINDIPEEDILDIESYDDIPNDLEELHIADGKGNLIWTIIGKQQIKEFFDDREALLRDKDRIKSDYIERIKKENEEKIKKA